MRRDETRKMRRDEMRWEGRDGMRRDGRRMREGRRSDTKSVLFRFFCSLLAIDRDCRMLIVVLDNPFILFPISQLLSLSTTNFCSQSWPHHDPHRSERPSAGFRRLRRELPRGTTVGSQEGVEGGRGAKGGRGRRGRERGRKTTRRWMCRGIVVDAW